MNVATRPALIGRTPPDPDARADPGPVRINLFDDFASAEQAWRRLEAATAYASPYQSFAWVSHWFNHVGRVAGSVPLLAAGFDRDDTPRFILPFISTQHLGCHVVRYCGGSHSNLNLPIWRPDAPPNAAVLAEIAALRTVDLFALTGQPQSWQGVRHPFATLPRQPSADDVYTGRIGSDGPLLTPRLPDGMRKKERKIMRLPGFRYARAQTTEEAEQIIATFWTQKAERFAERGIHNVFAEPGVVDFIYAAALDGLTEGRPAIELHALWGAGEILATVGGVCSQQRLSIMFNSITSSALSRLSPGIILLSKIIADCTRRGITSFDFGAGQEPYKSYFCSESERRFDCFVPFSARGRLLAAALRGTGALRHSLKTNTTLLNALHGIRRRFTASRVANP
jgi:CelD/BcsL family acetyltransferase involved in cellulose biosynthesis